MATSKHSSNNPNYKVGQIANAMLDGSMHYLEGAAELIELRELIGAYANDPDFFPFVAVLAEIRSLPIGKPPNFWTKLDHACYNQEIQQSVEWAKEISLHHCQSLAQRYSPPTQKE